MFGGSTTPVKTPTVCLLHPVHTGTPSRTTRIGRREVRDLRETVQGGEGTRSQSGRQLSNYYRGRGVLRSSQPTPRLPDTSGFVFRVVCPPRCVYGQEKGERSWRRSSQGSRRRRTRKVLLRSFASTDYDKEENERSGKDGSLSLDGSIGRVQREGRDLGRRTLITDTWSRDRSRYGVCGDEGEDHVRCFFS